MATTAVEINEDGEKEMSTETEEDSIHITEDAEDRLFWQRNLVTPVKATTGVDNSIVPRAVRNAETAFLRRLFFDKMS